MGTASTVAIETDDGLDGRPGDGAVDGLRESLQRFPSREEVDRRLFADGRQRRDRRAPIADENRSVFPGRSHPRASTAVQLPDRDLLHVSHCHTSLIPSATHTPHRCPSRERRPASLFRRQPPKEPAFAKAHSRSTVAGDIPNASAASSMLNPAKNRSSTTWLCRASIAASAGNRQRRRQPARRNHLHEVGGDRTSSARAAAPVWSFRRRLG